MSAFSKALLGWFDREQRTLPWRETSDPWAIWVSEIMLQQTRVGVVQNLYPIFMKRFPTPASLALASDDELLAAWKGLGYYRRARLLRDGALAVVEQHGGRIPETKAGLAALPGIGPYTSGAIASIAFGHAEVAIDGNVERVAARHEGIQENIKTGASLAKVRDLVLGWMDSGRAGDFNQALMELGALICTPRTPKCSLCPVSPGCFALERGAQAELPVLPARRATVEVLSRAVLVPLPHGRVLGTRIPQGEINGGQVDLPGPGTLTPLATASDLQNALEQLYGVAFETGQAITTVRHAITHHRVQVVIHQARCARGPGPNLMAARPDDETVPWTTVARKAFRQAALFLAARE